MRAMRASLLMGFAVMLLSVAPSADQPWSMNGTVVVRTHHNYVVVGVAPEGGGKLEWLFVFWPTEPLMASVKRYQKSVVTYDGTTLWVSQPDAKAVQIYYVTGTSKPTVATALASTFYAGKGLSHYYGEVPSRFGVSGSARRDRNVCYLDLAVCKDKIFEF